MGLGPGDHLVYGDNLDVLRRRVPDASVDLVYLDPPFDSDATYNLVVRDPSGAGSGANIEAFEDTWAWGEADEPRSGLIAGPCRARMHPSFGRRSLCAIRVASICRVPAKGAPPRRREG